jgi:1-acyl-sn-glycerol-3-phosphate acyltransferase
LQKLIWVPTRILLRACGRIDIRGLEHLEGLSTNAIFALNHSSELDVFLLPGSLPFWSRFSPIFYTSREQAFYKRAGWRQRFYGGAFFKAWGAYPVRVGLNDYGSSLADHIRILRDGGSVCIFPEGRTTRDGTIGEGKGGVAHLSYATKLPIIPVRLGGTFRIRPARFFLGHQRLSISFGAPIYDAARADRIPSYDVFKSYAALVMDRIRELPAVPVTVPEAASPSLEPRVQVQPIR